MNGSLDELCHLWRCAAFGASGESLQRSRSQGYEATVRELMGWSTAETTEAPPFTTVLPPGIMLGILQIGRLVQWWLNEMATTPYPLREKMVLFWHGHFTTSADPVISGTLLLRQNQLFRERALGRFEDLLLAVARDPAMLVYLDGKENRKAHPNENFARELLELFTLGIGHYTETDIKEAARAFTGWTLHLDGSAVYVAGQHDDGDKHFLGQTGPFTGEDIIRIVAHHPQTARRVCGRLYRFLTGGDAPPAELARLSQIFVDSHGSIGSVLHAILLGQAFRQAPRSFKSPVEWLVNALRILDTQVDSLAWLDPLRIMGQLPFLPPSVKGWDDGPAWINTATLLDRVNFAGRLVEHLNGRNSNGASLVTLVEQDDARQAVRSLLWTLGLGDASAPTTALLEKTWTASRPQGSIKTARRLVTLALASPEFQMK